MLGKYLEIFSDPFFWLMMAIAIFIGFLTYRKYVAGNYGVNEEVEHLAKQLKYYRLKYLSSETISEKDVVFNQTGDESNAPAIYTYRKVLAQNSNGETLEFVTQIEYRNSSLAAVYWQPDITKAN